MGLLDTICIELLAAIHSYPSAQPSPMVPLGHSCLLQQLAGDLPHLNISVNVSESVSTLLANHITKRTSPLPTGLNNHSIKMYQRGTNALFRRLRFKIMKTYSGRSDVKYTLQAHVLDEDEDIMGALWCHVFHLGNHTKDLSQRPWSTAARAQVTTSERPPCDPYVGWLNDNVGMGQNPGT